MRRWRYALVVGGILVLLYGGLRLVFEVPRELVGLVLWMAGVVVAHDALLAPLVVGLGWVLARTVPPRPRRFVQTGLVVGGLVSVVAIPLILREGTKPPAKALLLQDYGANLAILLGLVAVGSIGGYLLSAARRGTHAGPQERP